MQTFNSISNLLPGGLWYDRGEGKTARRKTGKGVIQSSVGAKMRVDLLLANCFPTSLSAMYIVLPGLKYPKTSRETESSFDKQEHFVLKCHSDQLNNNITVWSFLWHDQFPPCFSSKNGRVKGLLEGLITRAVYGKFSTSKIEVKDLLTRQPTLSFAFFLGLLSWWGTGRNKVYATKYDITILPHKYNFHLSTLLAEGRYI